MPARLRPRGIRFAVLTLATAAAFVSTHPGATASRRMRLDSVAAGNPVPNDTQPFWSWDTRYVGFDHVTRGRQPRVWIAPSGHGPAHALAVGLVRGFRPAGSDLLVQTGDVTRVLDRRGHQLGGVNGTDASWSPDGGSIAYLANGVLSVADATGAHARSLGVAVRPPSWDQIGPAWSPDGTRVAISTLESTGGSSILVVDVGTGAVTTLFRGPNQNVNPSWQWQSALLAFESNASGHWNIWIVRPNGADAAVAQGLPGANDRFPQWSPIGNRLAFTTDRQRVPGGASRFRYALAVWDMDENGKLTLLGSDARPDSPARWSPTGAQLVYAAGSGCKRFGIVVVGWERGRARRISNRC
jgi:hypothetical protein